ncbi:HIT family protein [Moritella sp. 36]|uniref:HIT family protein n=1 Tax=Moritella sp. 36 TaxID=2746233 RepID=UPI001BA4CBB4|nr:HIT family protein [Moritella sp. 36]QUM89629.1 HIT family protein [Moritella sp. 36]
MFTEYDNNNLFAKILKNEIPCIKVYEDEYTLAFLDIMPQMEGHTLVIPKESAVTIYDLTDEAALACMRTVKLIASAVEKAVGFAGSTVFQHNGEKAGQTVPHFHFHVLPGSIFDASAIKGHAVELASPDDLNVMADKIIACIEAAQS